MPAWTRGRGSGCPFGAGALDPDLLGRVRRPGLPEHAGWHVDTEDWQPAERPEELTTIVVDGRRARATAPSC